MLSIVCAAPRPDGLAESDEKAKDPDYEFSGYPEMAEFVKRDQQAKCDQQPPD